MSDLSQSELFVLRWLAREETSQLGECKGAALDALLNRNLAQIVYHRTPADYSLVSVTDEGWATLKRSLDTPPPPA